MSPTSYLPALPRIIGDFLFQALGSAEIVKQGPILHINRRPLRCWIPSAIGRVGPQLLAAEICRLGWS